MIRRAMLPLLTSANGQHFLAHLPRKVTTPFIAAELAVAKTRPVSPQTMQEVEELAIAVRHRRMSCNNEVLTPGVTSLAAPVFDHRGELACTIALVGGAGGLDLAWDGVPARMLAAAARRFSERLGAPDAMLDAAS